MASFENIALNKLLQGQVDLLPDLSLDYFSGMSNKVYRIILDYYSEHNRLPTTDMLKATINSVAPVAKRGVYVAMVDSITSTDTASVDNTELVKALADGFTLRNVDDKMEELLDAQRNKDANKVKGILSNLLEDLSIQRVSIGNFQDEIEKDDHFTVVPSGLGEAFDQEIGGGYAGVTLITAKSGGGKSILLQQCAIESFIAGKNVLYLSLELSPKVLGNRVKAYLTGLSFTDINAGKLTPEQKTLVDTRMAEVFNGKTNKWRVSSSPVDTDELLNIIKVEKQLHDIDLVVIDYLSLVSPSKYDRGEGWVTLSNLVKRLHKYTMSENLVIVTAGQINEVKKGKDNMEPEITTRGSKELEFSSTQFYYLEAHESQDPAHTPMTLFQKKNRIAKKTHRIVEGSFSTMQVKDTGINL